MIEREREREHQACIKGGNVWPEGGGEGVTREGGSEGGRWGGVDYQGSNKEGDGKGGERNVLCLPLSVLMGVPQPIY